MFGYAMETLSVENRVILTILYCFVMIFGISGNLRVIYSLVAPQANRRNISNSYLLALSITDFLYCLMYPSYIIPSLIDNKMNIQDEILCKIITFVSYTLATAGAMVITALSLDRYLAMKYPFIYRWKREARVASLANLLAYTCPLACFCPLLVAEEWVVCYEAFGEPIGANWEKIPVTYVVLLGVILFVIPGIILAITNVSVFTYTKKRYLYFQKHSQQIKNIARSRSKTVKLNQVSDAYFTHLHHEANRVSEPSSKNTGNELRTKHLEQTSFCEDVTNDRRAIVTEGINPDDSTNHEKLKMVQLKNKTSFQNIDCHRDANSAITAITANPHKLIDIEKLSSGDNRIHQRSSETSEKQLKQRRMQKDWKIAMMTVALVIAFVITWLPFLVCRLVSVFSKNSLASPVRLYTAALTTANSVINPYLVLATRNDIRENLLRKQRSIQAN